MTNEKPHLTLHSYSSLRARLTIAALMFGLSIFATQAVQAQAYQVIHNFTGGQDGAVPRAGLTMDKAGNLYGTTVGVVPNGNPYGTVFQLRRTATGWIFNPLYDFAGGSDGAGPNARVVFGPDGSLYGTTTFGGGGTCTGFWNGCGTIFRLRPPATTCKASICRWQKTVLYEFTGGSDGLYPYGDLIFDHSGNLYGTTYGAGTSAGVAYELTPANGGWTETVLCHFTGGADGALPFAGLIFDTAGNLYGTTVAGGNLQDCSPLGCGTVFQLSPSGSGWTENVLYTFQGANDGSMPYAGLVLDNQGDLYGATANGGTSGGTVFQLTPSNGNWMYALLYSFGGYGGPHGTLIIDAAGNLYGTTLSDGLYGGGSVFKLTPSNGGWTYTSLYDFCAGGYPCSDGSSPYSNLVFDSNGNLFGTTSQGGAYGWGVAFEITPLSAASNGG